MQMPPPLPPPLFYATPTPPRVHAGAIVAWVIIGLIAIAVPVLTHLGARQVVKPATQPTEADWQLVMSGRYTYQAAKTFGNSDQLLEQFEGQYKTPDGEIASAILRGELTDRQSAIDRLSAMRSRDADDALLLYSEHGDSTPVSGDSFVARYPWYTDLARSNGAPADDPVRVSVNAQAKRVFALIFGGGAGAILLMVAGVMLLTLAVILLAMKKMRLNMPIPAGPSHTYVEGFAAYLVTMLMGSIAFELIAKALSFEPSLLVRMIPLGFAVLVGVAWPIARGAKWEVFRRDVGLHTGSGVLTEIGCGIVGYIACLPILAVFFCITWVLMYVSGQTPSHPLTDQASDLSPLVMLLVASVFAPITEELLFRGLLLANLRGALSRTLGIVLGPLIVGFVFASIHPQGWLGIPILMAIGASFAVMRMWRDSLIGPMLAHAVHNGAVVTFVILISTT